jgi:hypothetical protein
MPKPKRTPAELPSCDLILAAIDRAERHSRGMERGVLLATVKEHLALPHHSGTTRQLRPKIDALHTLELIEPIRRDGMNLLVVTEAGRSQLETASEVRLSLPEAPQHQCWSEARSAAAERIPGFRADLREALKEATNLLDTNQEADSATWFEMSERLHQTGRLFASATYCLHEWTEPDDAHPDHDDPPYGQRSRRQIRGWDSAFPR